MFIRTTVTSMLKKSLPEIAASAALFLFAFQTCADSRLDSAGPLMRYRFVTADQNTWCDPQKQSEVATEIDRIVGDGFNAIAIGTYKFMPMYFVDYSKTKYPEAQEFESAKVEQNVATLRRNIRLAKARGIQLFVSQSYCHYAPYNFWKAHQRELNPNGIFTPLLEEAHQSDIYENALAGKDRIIPQQQWSNPCFHDFFLYSTAATLDAIPELDGFLNAYAEAAWHYDVEKLKASNWKSWKEIVDYSATDNEFVDYCNSLYRMVKEKRGAQAFFGMRDWYVKPDVMKRLDIPKKDFIISVKYSGFDQPLINYPPWAKTLQDEGYSVILDMLVYDAEHPHPLYWYDPEMVFGIYSNIYSAEFSGVMYQDFVVKGEDSPDNPIRLLTEKTVGAAVKRRPVTQQDALAFLRPYFGKGSEELLVSLKKVSVAQAEMIKLCPAWFWQGDGLTPGGLVTLRFWMLMDNPDAPPGMAFVRQNVIGVKEYVSALLAGDAAFKKSETKWQAQRKETPDEVMSLMLNCADDAITAAEHFREETPANAPYVQDIVASAVIHKELVLRDVAFLKAAIAFYKSGGQYDGKYNETTELQETGVNERDQCIQQLKSLIGHDEILRKLCQDYAPRRRQTRSKNDYAFEKKIAAILGRNLDLPAVNTQELKYMTSLIIAQ